MKHVPTTQTMSQSSQVTHSSVLTGEDVTDAYARWAPVYDFAFKLVMRPGRVAAARFLNAGQGTVLDAGVGTGLELPLLSSHLKVTGIDLSEPMLARARQRVARLQLSHVVSLEVMDAMDMAFADGSFDAVVAPYLLPVVPDPHRTLDELVRVVKPGGQIVIVNHIGAERGIAARFEHWLARHSARLGWRPEFPWSIIGDWLATRTDVTLVQRQRLAPFGLFTLIRLQVHAQS